ncbi:acetylcholine receptor subunit alpha-1-A-like [Hyalella azteca]|uniref:Acetylcholine receptor subunit alpha-1-A-like n=1 Tax=Hyalella azteca TaxID=294128 RepID=A0A8B7N8S7_HYAAZ|nr:acetylcholine receptor subunit alpha-1-A-like [Hyalella azteca]
MSHAIFCSVCDVNVEFYPFDQQACQMKFSSWTYDVTNIVVSEAMVDIGHFNENPEFFLEDFYVTKTEEFNDCCPLPFSTLKYVVQLQRQSKFALFFYVVPGILINICALLVFLLPVESGEKVGLGVNSMLAMIVFLIAMTENLPPTEKLPLAGVYYGVCLSLVAINIAFSVYVLNLNYTGLRGFVVPRPMRRDAAIVSTKVEILSNSDNPDLPDHIRELFPDFVPAANQPPPLKDAYERRACSAVEKLAALFEKQDSASVKAQRQSVIQDEWKFVSRTLDRLLVIVFAVIALIFNVYLLAASPFGYKFEFCPLLGGCDDMTEHQVRDLIKRIAEHTATGLLPSGVMSTGH